MELRRVSKGINYSLSMIGVVLALNSSAGYAGTMGPVVVAPGKIYVGVFGGGGSSNRVGINQFGTALFIEAQGGPLAVNSFGTSNSRSMGIVGGQVGYQWPELLSNPLNLQWGISPAIELEGYYLGRSSFTGHDINNDTVRLPEHDFLVTYPLRAGVFLTNAVLNFNSANYAWLHPYVGVGIGTAVVSISNASSIQTAPPEAGVNHYNASTGDRDTTFATQAKLGLNFDFTPNISMFVEYRWLYLADTHFTFGSTVYPAHAPTTSWLVNMDHQNYNMGAVGLRFSV